MRALSSCVRLFRAALGARLSVSLVTCRRSPFCVGDAECVASDSLPAQASPSPKIDTTHSVHRTLLLLPWCCAGWVPSCCPHHAAARKKKKQDPTVQPKKAWLVRSPRFLQQDQSAFDWVQLRKPTLGGLLPLNKNTPELGHMQLQIGLRSAHPDGSRRSPSEPRGARAWRCRAGGGQGQSTCDELDVLVHQIVVHADYLA